MVVKKLCLGRQFARIRRLLLLIKTTNKEKKLKIRCLNYEQNNINVTGNFTTGLNFDRQIGAIVNFCGIHYVQKSLILFVSR